MFILLDKLHIHTPQGFISNEETTEIF